VNANGEVTGAPVNMGGLVNRAAFKTIQPIWSKDQSTSEDEGTMDPTEQLKTTQSALASANLEITTLKTRLAGLESGQIVRARDAEISHLKATVAGLEAQVKAHRTERARARVQEAVHSGRLAPQATEIHAKWTTLIEADEKNAELLDSMPINSALTTIVQNWNSTTHSTQPGTAEGFVALVHARQTTGRTKSEALDAAIAENLQAYRAWRDANGRPAI
jgi:hypothetical protein